MSVLTSAPLPLTYAGGLYDRTKRAVVVLALLALAAVLVLAVPDSASAGSSTDAA